MRVGVLRAVVVGSDCGCVGCVGVVVDGGGGVRVGVVPAVVDGGCGVPYGVFPAVVDGGPCGCGVESTVLDGLRVPPAVLRPGGVPTEVLAAAPEMAGIQVRVVFCVYATFVLLFVFFVSFYVSFFSTTAGCVV